MYSITELKGREEPWILDCWLLITTNRMTGSGNRKEVLNPGQFYHLSLVPAFIFCISLSPDQLGRMWPKFICYNMKHYTLNLFLSTTVPFPEGETLMDATHTPISCGPEMRVTWLKGIYPCSLGWGGEVVKGIVGYADIPKCVLQKGYPHLAPTTTPQTHRFICKETSRQIVNYLATVIKWEFPI